MYLLVKFGDHSPYRNRDINSDIKSYLDTLENAGHFFKPPPSWIFKIMNTDLQFRSPGYDRQKNKKKKKNMGNCKAFRVDTTKRLNEILIEEGLEI